MAITYSNVAGAEPSTVTFVAATVTVQRGSTNEKQELICVADPMSSIGVARVLAIAPTSTEFGLTVRIASGPSSAADMPVQISGNSTVIQGTSPWVISGNSTSIQGTSPWVISGNSTVIQGTNPWVVSPNSTAFVKSMGMNVDSSNALLVKQDVSVRLNIGSTAADNAVAISGNSTVMQGTSPWVVSEAMNSTVAPSSASSGVICRIVVDTILTTASSNAFASTSLVVQSSGAALRSYVVAYSLTSTVQSPTQMSFMSGSTLIWPIVLAALSSAVSGVNLAVSAPGYLFRTKSAGPLSVNVDSSVAGVKAAVSYFRAP